MRKLRDGDEWWVEAEWPDGTIEKIKNFKNFPNAVHWLKLHSKVWVRERTVVAAANATQKAISAGKMVEHAAALQRPLHKLAKI